MSKPETIADLDDAPRRAVDPEIVAAPACEWAPRTLARDVDIAADGPVLCEHCLAREATCHPALDEPPEGYTWAPRLCDACEVRDTLHLSRTGMNDGMTELSNMLRRCIAPRACRQAPCETPAPWAQAVGDLIDEGWIFDVTAEFPF